MNRNFISINKIAESDCYARRHKHDSAKKHLSTVFRNLYLVWGELHLPQYRYKRPQRGHEDRICK